MATTCTQCSGPVVQKGPGREKKFCSRICYKAHYRQRVLAPPFDPQGECAVCKIAFVKVKRHQRFCSRQCYLRAWQLDRKKHNELQTKRRRENPEWFRQREPGYYQSYRRKKLTTRPWAYLLQSARLRAVEKNWEFELTDEWAAARWNDCCEITGILFCSGGHGKGGPNPFSASVDRKDSTLGYTQNNSRFILWGCNAIKGVGGDNDMYEIAEAIVRNKPK